MNKVIKFIDSLPYPLVETIAWGSVILGAIAWVLLFMGVL